MTKQEMHPVLIVAYNNLALTRDCFSSLLSQDIGPLHILFINNGSTDGTREWLSSMDSIPDPHIMDVIHEPINKSPVALTNMGLDYFFSQGYEEVLAIPNDVVLPPNCYRLMDEYPSGIVTASQVGDNPPPTVTSCKPVHECTPMAVVIFRKWLYDAVVSRYGYFFNDAYFNYCSDCDLALRFTSMGIHGIQLDLPYYHYGSASWRLAPDAERYEMLHQADKDRETFKGVWGFAVDALEYGRCAVDLDFKGIPLPHEVVEVL